MASPQTAAPAVAAAQAPAAVGRGGKAASRAPRFEATARIDTPKEIDYYKHGGILLYVLRNLAG